MPFALLMRFGGVALGSLGLDRVVSWFDGDDNPDGSNAGAIARGLSAALGASLLALVLAVVGMGLMWFRTSGRKPFRR